LGKVINTVNGVITYSDFWEDEKFHTFFYSLEPECSVKYNICVEISNND